MCLMKAGNSCLKMEGLAAVWLDNGLKMEFVALECGFSEDIH